ncbi:MAG: trypsin-like serine protease [Bdellovibrionota bacterium]
MIGLAISCFIFLKPTISNAVIYGEDNRKPISKELAEKMGLKPIVAILVEKVHKSNYPCNGVWISKIHILTAAHCVANSKKILIYNQYDKLLTTSKATGKKIYVDINSSNNQSDWEENNNSKWQPNSNDWAVIEVEEEEIGAEPEYVYNPATKKMVKNLHRYEDGSIMGTLPISSTESLKDNPWITFAGHHDDAYNSLYREQCRYQERMAKDSYWLMFRPNVFEFDCDVISGSSGSPLLSCDGAKCKIVGILSGEFYPDTPVAEFSHRYANTAVHTKNFIVPVTQLLKGNKAYVKSFDLEKMKCRKTDCLKN